MLDTVTILSHKEAVAVLERARAVAAQPFAAGAALLTALENVMGNDCCGPALPSDAPSPLLRAREALTDALYGVVSADTGIARIAAALR